MRIDLEQKEREILRKHKYNQRYIIVLSALSALVASAVSVSLIKPAESLAVICGFSEHTHSEDCYELACEKIINVDEETGEETEHIHSFDEGCYDLSEPVCGQEEHTHAYECFRHDEDGENAPDMLTAEETEELEKAEEPAEIQEAGNTDITDDAADEPVSTGIPEVTITITTETTTIPADTDIVLVSGVTATYRITEAVTVADWAANVVTGVTQRTDYPYKVDIYETYENKNEYEKEIKRLVVIDNDTDTDMLISVRSLRDHVANEYAGCMYNSSVENLFETGDMWLEIAFAGKWMTDPGSQSSMISSGYCELPYTLVTKENGTETRLTGQKLKGQFFYNKEGKPVFVFPMRPLKSHQKYEIRNNMTVDPREYDSSPFGDSELLVGANITVRYYNQQDGNWVGASRSSRDPDWKLRTGFSFDKRIIMDEDLEGHNYGMMKWEIHFRNPNRFDLSGMSIFCSQFSSATDMLVSDMDSFEQLNTWGRAYHFNEETRTGDEDENGKYDVALDKDGNVAGRMFTFKGDPKTASDYCFVFTIPYRIWVGTYTPFAEIKTGRRIYSNMFEKEVDISFAGSEWESLRFSIPAFMHANINESSYDEMTHTSDTKFEFDFGFPHNYNHGINRETCIGKTFTCDLKSLTDIGFGSDDKDIIAPDISGIKVISYREYKLEGVDVTGNGSYTTSYNESTKQISITFNSMPEQDTSPGREQYYTAELKIIIPVQITANSIKNERSVIAKIQATGGYDSQSYEAGTNVTVVTIGNSFRIFDNFRHGYNQNDTTHSLELVNAPTDQQGGQGGFLTWSVEAGATGKYYIAKMLDQGEHAGENVVLTARIPQGVVFDANDLIFKVHDEMIKEDLGNGEYRYKYDESHWAEYKYDSDENKGNCYDHGLVRVEQDSSDGSIYYFEIDISKDKYLAVGKQFRITIPVRLTNGTTDGGITEDTIYKTYTLTVNDNFDSAIRRSQKQKIPTTIDAAQIVPEGRHLKYTNDGHAVLEYTFTITFTGKMDNRKLVFDIGAGQKVTDEQRTGLKIYKDDSNHALSYTGSGKRYNEPVYDSAANKLTVTFAYEGTGSEGNDNTPQKLKVVFCTTSDLVLPAVGSVFNADGSIYRGSDLMTIGTASAVIKDSEFIRVWDGLDDRTLGQNGIGLDRQGVIPPGRNENYPTMHEWAYLNDAGSGKKELKWMIQGNPVSDILGYPPLGTSDHLEAIDIWVTLPAGMEYKNNGKDILYIIDGNSNNDPNWELNGHLGTAIELSKAQMENGYLKFVVSRPVGYDIRLNHKRFVIAFSTTVEAAGTYTIEVKTFPIDEGNTNGIVTVKQTQRVTKAGVTGNGKCISVKSISGDNLQSTGTLEYNFDISFYGMTKGKSFTFDITPVADPNTHKIDDKQAGKAPAGKGDVLVYRMVNGSEQCLPLGTAAEGGRYTQSKNGSGSLLTIDSTFEDTTKRDERFRIVFRTTAYKKDALLTAGFKVKAKIYDEQNTMIAESKSVTVTVGKVLLARLWDYNDRDNINAEPTDSAGGLGKDNQHVSRNAATTHDWLSLDAYRSDPDNANMRELVWVIQGNPISWMTGFAKDRDIEIKLMKKLDGENCSDMVWNTADIKLYTIGRWDDGDWKAGADNTEYNLKPAAENLLSFDVRSNDIVISIPKESEIVQEQLRFVIKVPVGIPKMSGDYTLTAYMNYSGATIDQTQTIANIPGPMLPSTGGSGTEMFIFTGIALMICSITFTILIKRQR